MKNLLVILGIVVCLIEIYGFLRRYWIHLILEKKKKARQSRQPLVMRPKSELDCPLCVEEKGKHRLPRRETPMAWGERKGSGGPKKKTSTDGYFCGNQVCGYYGITDEKEHALVWDGSHGKREEIRDLKCQACRKKFNVRKNTMLYRLKMHSEMVEKIMWLLALGVDASALEEVFGVREITIRSRLWRSGMQGRKLHERFMIELDLIHVQLDELWGNVESNGQELWLWATTDVKTKIVLVLQLRGRTQEMAYRVVHELKGRLRMGRVPVFSTDDFAIIVMQ